MSRQIIDMIRSGRPKPGMRIPSKNEIMREYNVSNTTT
ncbi:MAG: GntR family transcriptional regulator [Planctomycetota bacterium]